MATRRPLVLLDSGIAGELPATDQLPIGILELPKGYIDGLQMKWVSGTALTVTSGAAYIEGSGKVLRATADIAKTGLSLSASTWYHIYLYSNAGTPDVELSTTAPASAYNGTARSKTGDSSRRYVGSVRTDGSGNILRFGQDGNEVTYLLDVNQRFLLSNGTATTSTTVSAASLCPTTALVATVFAQNTWSDNAYLGNADVGALGLGANRLAYLLSNTVYPVRVPLASDQSLLYLVKSGSGSGLTLFLSSYTFSR